MKRLLQFRVEDADHKRRFDEFLFDRVGALSKMHLRNLALAGKGRVNGDARPPGHRLSAGDEVEIEVDLSVETSMKPEPLPLEILYEDAELVVVNKPAEMLVHPTRGVKSGTLLNALSYHLNSSRDSGPFTRPGLIHRLDKKTSGLMVLAKTARALRVLSGHFNRKLVEKKYLAVVEGIVEADGGAIEAPIGQDEAQRLWRVMEPGKSAETRFRVLERGRTVTLLELEPVTGRTNQLRAHCAFIDHPIVGDTVRGGREFPRLCLHAACLAFRHPATNERLEFRTEMPEEMNSVRFK